MFHLSYSLDLEDILAMSKPKTPNRSLRYYREVRNWTQEQAAEALLELCGPGRRGEINAKMISKWERGVQTPGLEYREKLCKLYGVQSPEELGVVKREEPPDGPLAHRKLPAPTILSNASPVHLQPQEHAWLTQGASHLGQLLTEGWSIDEILASLQIVLQGVQRMPIIMRRNLLALGADAMIHGIPVLAGKHVSEEELVQLHHALGESIAAGWKLFHTAGNAQVLAVGQTLLHVVQQNHSLLFPRVRSMYYSAVYNLIGLALHFQEYYQDALDAHTNAHIAALSTGDPLYVAQSLICQANAYQALEQHSKALHAIEEALLTLQHQTDQMSLRAKAHLLGCWADSAMTIGAYTTAQRKLEASAQYLDQLGPNEEFDHSSWLQLAGKYALMTNDYSTAIQHLEKALTRLPSDWILRHIITSVPLAIAYARKRERDASLAVAERVVPMIRTMDAQMTNGQFGKYIQQDLLGLFPNDPKVRAFVHGMSYQLPLLQ